MNAAGIIYQDIANGPGIRTSIFVSGCRRHCPGCHNQKMWDFGYGIPFDDGVREKILESLAPEWVQGLSILGGEPFEPENEPGLVSLAEEVKKRYPEKDIWVYSGYTYKELEGRRLLELCDVLVDGEYSAAERDISLPFRGSRNQKIVKLK